MATGELIIGSDGELTLMVGRWSKDKLFYIRRYCDIFNTDMKEKWAVRTYIDLFSGPGKCFVEAPKEEIDGSPLIALKCKVPFTHYFFNDIQPNVVDSLKTRASSFSFATLQYYKGDCSSVIDDLVNDLPDGSLDFCFIDPFNWEINFNSVRKLTEKRRMDLAITFHVGSMKRVAHNPPKELLDFFPDHSWQQEYKDAGKKGKSKWYTLLSAYERGLTKLGYKEIKDYVLEKNNRGVPLYHLIFASKHSRGADFWDKIAGRSEAGQLRMQLYIESHRGEKCQA